MKYIVYSFYTVILFLGVYLLGIYLHTGISKNTVSVLCLFELLSLDDGNEADVLFDTGEHISCLTVDA